MGTLRLIQTFTRSAEAYGGGVWGHPPTENLEILQPPRSVLRPYTVAKCKSLMANAYDDCMGLVIRCDTAPFNFKTV